MSKVLILAEKPSQCRSLVKALDKNAIKKNGYYESDSFIFTNVRGHFLGLPKAKFRDNLNDLPFSLNVNSVNVVSSYEVSADKSKDYKILQSLLARKDIVEVVCATDPDAEGEAIYREIIESCNKSELYQTRLIIKDTTVDGLRNQWEIRKPINEYEGLRQRAFARAVSDWLIGMNISQAVMLKSGVSANVGRVKSPLMKLVVDRYKQNQNFKKSKSYILEFNVDDITLSNIKNKFDTKQQALEFKESITFPILLEVNQKFNVSKQPSLYDLADIQKFGNKTYNFTTSKVLKIVQSLYDKEFVTYPRTDCKLITENTANILDSIYGIDPSNNNQIARKNIGEVSAHEGLTLTAKVLDAENLKELSDDEIKIYEEINKRFKANYLDEATSQEAKVHININGTEYSNEFNKITQLGYLKSYNDKPFKNVLSNEEFDKLDSIAGNLPNDKIIINIKEVESSPKPLFTEASLLSKMQNIHNDIEDEDLKKISKSINGIGTPATRADLIKELFKKNYFEMNGKSIVPTSKCIELVEILEKLECPLVNVEYTAKIESSLAEVERDHNFDEYIKNIEKLNKIIVNKIQGSDITFKEKELKNLGSCPKCQTGNITKLSGKYGDFFLCNKEECGYKIPNYYNFTESDIQNILKGKSSSIKNLKNKDNKSYKAKFKMVNGKLEREFINTKKRKR